jgi:hypothetical protein
MKLQATKTIHLLSLFEVNIYNVGPKCTETLPYLTVKELAYMHI